MNKRRIYAISGAAVISIVIGVVTNILMGGSLNRPLISYLWSAGYSISLGLPLFGNGLLFEFYAKRFIDWINRPYKSILIALTIHLVYSSFVIFVVNWFWFVYLRGSSWDNFWMQKKATIISEYIIFIIVASIIYAVNFFKAWRHQLQETEKMKSETLALKYKVLQDQINPHFLFNSLNILGSLIDLNADKAKDIYTGAFVVLS